MSPALPLLAGVLAAGVVAPPIAAASVQEFAMTPPPVLSPTSGADISEMVAGPDGNLWYPGGSRRDTALMRVAPSGQVTRLPVPFPFHAERDLTVGADGNLYFAAHYDDGLALIPGYMGRVTPAGEFSVFTTPTTSRGSIENLVAGP